MQQLVNNNKKPGRNVMDAFCAAQARPGRTRPAHPVCCL